MSNPTKSILFIGINFSPEPTGIGKYTGEMAHYLAEQGHKVEVITAFPYYPHWKIADGYRNGRYRKEISQGVTITRCPLYVPGSLSGGKRMLQDFSFFCSALLALQGKMMRRKRYDLVFVPSPSFMSGLLGCWYRIFFHKSKLVYHIQDLQVDAAAELGMIRQKSLLKLLYYFEGQVLKTADVVSTISLGMQRKILAKKEAPKKVALLPNWVDFAQVFRTKPDQKILSSLGIPANKKIFFYSGAMGEKQGLELIFEAAAAAEKRMTGLLFVLSGTGPYRLYLEGEAQKKGLKNILFIDLQPLPVFNQLLNHAWCHLVIQKGSASDLLLPSKLTNILAIGGLSIVTAAPGTSLYHIVADNQLGLVVPPEDPKSFIQAIEQAYVMPAISALRENAEAFAKKNLRKEEVINGFLASVFPLTAAKTT